MENLTKMKCVVERVTYQNPDNGYSILRCTADGFNDQITVTGTFANVPPGSVLLVSGLWKDNPKYGPQFVSRMWEESLPATAYGIEKYLGSGLIKGIGPQTAKKIVARFGKDTLNILDNEIKRLKEVPGIGRKKIEQITESWETQKDIKSVMVFLQGYGISATYAAKIYKQYGKESVKKVRENPYVLADEIWGIGFKIADSIAEKLGFAKDAVVRLRSGLLYTLNEMAKEGHVFATRRQLLKRSSEILDVEEYYISTAMEQMIEEKKLVRQEIEKKEGKKTEVIYLPAFYQSETGVANRLKKLMDAPAKDRLWSYLTDLRNRTGDRNASVDVDKIQNQLHMEYDEVQADAIRSSAVSKVMVLTGGPGTGKTTTTQGIIAAFNEFRLKILCAAPTGRAAKRMTEATGMESRTIHRLLEYNPKAGYQRNEANPLSGDVLIIDESSMIDITLMYHLLKAVPDRMRLILIGDIDQLPSVGPGNVLRDIIRSRRVPVVRLTKIFRQAQTSRIIMNAHRVNHGEMPDTSNGMTTDFFFMQREDPEVAAKLIVDLVANKLPKCYNVDPSQIQVLTPMKKSATGTIEMNTAIQQTLNPHGECIKRGTFTYRVNDKVMQIRNNYDKDVFNGDIGVVVSVNPEDNTMTVDYDGHPVVYESDDLEELVLAYAVTIHKSQGSEYPIVVMPVMNSHYIMLQRNLIYTGITRAKKILVMVGTMDALEHAVNNMSVTRRNTLLSERISGSVETPDGKDKFHQFDLRELYPSN